MEVAPAEKSGPGADMSNDRPAENFPLNRRGGARWNNKRGGSESLCLRELRNWKDRAKRVATRQNNIGRQYRKKGAETKGRRTAGTGRDGGQEEE